MGPAVPEPMIWLATFAVLSTFTVTAVLPGVLPRVLETASIWTTERAAHAAGLLGAAPEACNFGVQPYYFEVTEDTTPFNVTPKTWDIHAFNPRCQPQPLLDDLLDANVSAGRQLSIIAFGDSIDRFMTDDFCKYAGTKLHAFPESPSSRRYQSVSWCSSDKFLLMQSWTNGLHPSRSKMQVQSPEGAMNQSRDMLWNLTGKRSPDILLVASCAWDIVHWMHNHTFWTRGPEPDAPPYLGGVRVNQYMDDLTQYLRMLRAGFPDTRLVAVHTMAQRSARQKGLLVEQYLDKTKPGTSAVELPAGHSRQLLWNRYIAAANSALRYVAAEEGLTLIDYESIMLQLPTAHAHFPDGFHPLGRLLTTVMMNLLLNEHAAMDAAEAAVAPQ